jgi:hypothetical protein
MLNSRIGRILATTVLAGAAVGALAIPAGAAAGSSIACKTLTGTITGNVTLKGCTGNTGKASKPLPATALASGGTITWKNGKTTTVTLTVTSGSGAKCAVGDSEYDATGKVTADTTGSAKVKGKATADVCVTPAGAVSLVPGTKAVLA